MRRFLLVFILLSSLTALAILAPTVFPVIKNGTEDVTVTFTANDFKEVNDGDILTKIKITSLPANGTLSLNGIAITPTDLEKEIDVADIATLTLVPNPDYNGDISFGWNGSDATEYAATSSTVTVTFLAVNDAPTLDVIADPAAINEDAGEQTVNLSGIGSGAADEAQTLVVTATSSDPALIPDPTLVYTSPDATGILKYTPAANQSGTATITVTVNDGGTENATVTQTFVVNITAVNDAPVAVADESTTDEDNAVTVDVSANDTDLEGNALTVTVGTVTGGDVTGTISVVGNSILFTPAPDFSGEATFTYNIDDGNGGTALGTVTVNVTAVNDAPVANSDTKNTQEDTPVSGTATASDVDGPSLTFAEVVGTAVNGTVSLASDGTYTFTPTANFSGTASFTFTASDGTATSDPATVTIDVAAVNDAPVANDGSASGTENGGAITGTLSASDIENDPLTYSIVDDVDVTEGVLTLNASTGAYSFTPAADYHGTVTFTFKAYDGTDYSNTATVTITVNALPTANDFPKSVVENQALTFSASDFSSKFSDPDGGTLTTIKIISLPPANQGKLMYNGSPVTVGQEIPIENIDDLIFVPYPGYIGTTSFGWTGFDGTDWDPTPATVTITITPQPRVLFNEFYTDPAPGNTEFFELYNPSTTTPMNLDCYTLVVYYDKGNGDKGFYVLDFPKDINIAPHGYAVGAAKSPFNYQKKTNEFADFNWNALTDAAGNSINGGSLKQYKYCSSCNNGNPGYEISTLGTAAGKPLYEFFINNDGNRLDGVEYLMFLFNNGQLANAFIGGNNSSAIPRQIRGGGNIPPMPNLPLDTDCSVNDAYKHPSIDWTKIKEAEFVTEVPGNKDNGFIRINDGMCGQWEKSSNPENSNEFEHNPGEQNGDGSAQVDNLILTVSAQRDVCGERIDVQIKGIENSQSKYSVDAVFPIEVLLYWDVDGDGVLDTPGDELIETKIINEPSDLFYVFDTDPGLKYLLVFKTDLGCIDKIVAPDLATLSATEKSYCGEGISITLNSATYNAFLEGTVTAQVYQDLGRQGRYDEGIDILIPGASVSFSDFGYTLDINIPEEYEGLEYIVVYTSTSSGCITRVGRPSSVSGSFNASGYVTCGTTGSGVKFSVTPTGEAATRPEFMLPITVEMYYDDGDGTPEANELLQTSLIETLPANDQPISAPNYVQGTPIILVFKSEYGCYTTRFSPTINSITTSEKVYCGGQIDFSISSATYNAGANGSLPFLADIYVDADKNGTFETQIGTALPVTTFGEIEEYVIPDIYNDGSYSFSVVYTSGTDVCVTKTVTPSYATGTYNVPAAYMTCGTQENGNMAAKFSVEGITGEASVYPEYAAPLVVKMYFDRNNNGEPDADEFENSETYNTIPVTGGEIESVNPYLLGTRVILVFESESGCYTQEMDLEENMCIILPVNLRDFSAVRNKQKVALKWETATEQKNKGFYIQRNVRGMWENRGFVPSAAINGNSNTPLSYTFSDPNEERGVSQYRLQQVDLDNKTAYSPIRSVPGLEQANKVVIYPNPSDAGKFNVVFSDQGLKNVVVSDVSGRVVRQYRSVQNSLVVDQLEPGMYTVQIIDLSSAETSVEKVIIKKR